jgi:demethoxyubiquinone hydroxylase (CLK1/Coq7/Cat5 family)
MGRPKKDSAIVLRDLDTRLVIPHDEPIIIKPTEDQIQNKKYYEDRIKELQESNRKYKDIINSLTGRQEELKYLRQFKRMLSGHCVTHMVTKTIIQCSETIIKGACTFDDQCIERKKWNNLLRV